MVADSPYHSMSSSSNPRRNRQDVLASLVSDLSFWELAPIREEEQPVEPVKEVLVEEEEEEPSRKQETPANTAAAAPVWKSAMDPVTGRTYYYDAITRKTQWEKPEEIRAAERKARKEQRRLDRLFFEDVQRNILASLARGEVIPGIARAATTQALPPKEPLPVPTVPQLRVRTISGMNEKLLAELQSFGDGSGGAEHMYAATSVTRNVLPTSSSSRPPVEGRPPLPTQGSSRRNFAHVREDSMELSPDQQLRKDDTDALRGEALLDGPILDESPSSPSEYSKASSSASTPLSHVRRNTGGTIYVKSTMENPDVNATIKCVCGVYRAHVVQAANRSQRSPVSVANTANVDLDIFRDDHDAHPYGGAFPSSKNQHVPVPSLAEIELFYHDFYVRSQMEHDTIIMSIIYVERLIKATNGALTPSPINWRSILFSCMVLSSKVWDDLSMFNLDFANVSMASGLSSFTLQRTNALELAVLQTLNFDVKVPASEYAKYYFLIRTMLIRSGMLEGAEVPMKKDIVQSRTATYQEELRARSGRRARSVDWSFFGRVPSSEPVLKDAVCLEQLESMDR